jgi:hypothetical protein
MEPFNAHGVVLFGLQETAIGAHLRNEPVHVVITAGPHHAVSQALAGTDVLHVDGPQYLPKLTSVRPVRGRGLHRTSANWTHR